MSAPRIRSTEALLEGLRIARSEWLTTLVCILVTSVATGLSAAASCVVLSRDQDSWRRSELAGAYTYLVTPGDPHDRLDSAACDGLRALDGVKAAGAIQEYERVRSTIPGREISVFRMTYGGLVQAFPEEDPRVLARSRAVAGRNISTLVGGSGGHLIHHGSGGALALLPVDHVATTGSRRAAMDSAVVVVDRSMGVVGACQVETAPESYEAVGQVIGSVLGTSAVVTPDTGHAGVVALARTTAERLTTWVGLGAGVATSVFFALLVWSQRHAHALYTMFAMTRARHLLLILSLWWIRVLWPAAAVSAAVALLGWPTLDGPFLWLAVVDHAVVTSALAAGPIWAWLLVRLHNPFVTLKQ